MRVPETVAPTERTMTIFKITRNMILLAFLLLPVLSCNVIYLFLSAAVFFADYIRYRLRATRRSQRDRMTAVQIDKKSVRLLQDLAPTWRERTEKNIPRFEDQRRYELISKQASLRREQNNILDIGSAYGTLALRLCSSSEYTICLDISRNLSRLALKNAKSARVANIDFVIGDAENLPFREDRFSTIIISEVIEHVPHPQILLAQARYVLSDGGSIILTTERQPHPYHVEPAHMGGACLWTMVVSGIVEEAIHASGVLGRRKFRDPT